MTPTSTAFLDNAARHLAEIDPLHAAKVFFQGLRYQPKGGRQAVIRYLIAELVNADRDGIAEVVKDLSRALAPRNVGAASPHAGRHRA